MNPHYQHFEQSFFISLIAAFLLHLGVLAVWAAMPKGAIESVPVSILNIRLGDDANLDDIAIVADRVLAPTGNIKSVESSLNKSFLARKTPAAKKLKSDSAKTVKKSATNQQASSKPLAGNQKSQQSGPTVPHLAREYVRMREAVSTSKTRGGAGDRLGNNTTASARKKAYTQTISLWLQKFKAYPQQARQQGMEGQAVVRLRVDRRGNIHYRVLKKRTPYPILDKAVLDMVRRADPVPPIPSDYPDQSQYPEFDIAINFRLDER